MEKSPVQYLAKLGIPVDRATSTGSYVSGEMGDMSTAEYDEMIRALVDQTPDHFPLRKQHHLTFAYLCQNIIKHVVADGIADVDTCYIEALKSVEYHTQVNPYFVNEYAKEGESAAEPMVVNGVTRERGWKREQAIKFMRDNKFCTRAEFIKHCIDSLGMTNAGATTYYATSFQAVHGCKPPSGKKKAKAA